MRSRLAQYQNGSNKERQLRQHRRKNQERVERHRHAFPDSYNLRRKQARKQWQTCVHDYEQAIREYHSHVCNCCGRLFRLSQLHLQTKSNLREKGFSDEFIKSVFWVRNREESKFCSTCIKDIRRNTVPKLCLSNGLEFPIVHEKILKLNRLEERLLAARHVFQTLWTVKGKTGQYKTKGGIVNVPVEIDNTVSAIPRPLSDSNMIHVRLARKMEYLKDYMAGIVRPKLLYDAAKQFTKMPLAIEQNITLSIDWDKNNNHLNYEYETDFENDFYTSSAIHETMLTAQDACFTGLLNDGVRMAPAEGFRPTSILFDDNCEYLAFPTIFGGYKMFPKWNNKPISYADFAKSMIKKLFTAFDDKKLATALQEASTRDDEVLENDSDSEIIGEKTSETFAQHQQTFDFDGYHLPSAENEYPNAEHVENTSSTAIRFSTPSKVPEEEFQAMFEILNQEQRDYIMHVSVMKTRGNRKNYKAMAEGADIDAKEFENFASDNISSLIKQEQESDDLSSNSSSIIMINSESETDKPSTSKKTQQILTAQNSKILFSSSDISSNEEKKSTSIKKISNRLSDSDTSGTTNNLPKKKQLKKTAQTMKPATSYSSTDEDSVLQFKKRKRVHHKRSIPSDESSDSERPPMKLQKVKHQSNKNTKMTNNQSSKRDQIHKRDQDTNSDSSAISEKPPAKQQKQKDYKKHQTKKNVTDVDQKIKELQAQLQTLINMSAAQKSKSEKKKEDSEESDSDDQTPKKVHKKLNRKPKQTAQQNDDDFINLLNDVQTYTCRDLKMGKSYKLLDLNITNETGFNGSYKKAVGKLQDKTRPNGYILITMPKPVASLNDQILQQMKSRIERNNNPYFLVNKITSRDRADGKGSYDVIDYKWM
ncbi:hypothetical protein KUF71_003815 [Frankliniella fusca]|uniref:DUF6570 domain-containing protein n=1 Tax=Frankliniella fusca TaxID=407009 RepID=A0AAE1L776_9NEOP|nr:hypothetical protein KUF71_003815 [Frankliniella fusca]